MFTSSENGDSLTTTEDPNVVKTRRIERKFEKIYSNIDDLDEQAAQFDESFDAAVQEDEISNLQGDFSKMSWDDSMSPNTNTLGDVGQNTPDNDIQEITTEASGEIDHSTDTTPVPFSAVVPKNDLPKPKPRSVVATSPISEFDDNLLTSTQEQITTEPLLTSTVDVTSESSVSAPVPVPKPRSQLKQTDSYKNLASLAEQSDSISLRSLEFTEDISKTDEPSTDISIRSQRDMHTTETESFEPTSESVDDVDTEKSDQADGKTTSFYIGESSRNVIVKTTPTKSTSEFITDANDAMQATIEAKDISLMKEVSVDSDENNDVFKEYVTMKRDQEEYGSKLIRQSSDTRNDLLEQESAESKQSKDALEKSVESTKLTSTVSTDDSIKEISEISRTDSQEYTVSTIITESLDTVLTDKGYTSVEKSELETLEKEIPLFQSKCKVIHSPQDLQVSAEEPMYKSTVEIYPAETQLSLDSASDSLKDISKDIEMPTEIKTVIASKEKEPSTSASIDTAKLSYASMQEEEDISSFIGIPDKVQEGIEKPFDTLQQTEGLFEGTVRETLNREAVMAHYAKDVFNNLKPETLDDHGSLGFVSTGTGEDYSSSEEHAAKEEHASLGFISTETAEDFSSMEDYYQEKMVKANILTEEATTQKSSSSSTFEEITSDQTMKPFDVVIHRVKTESSTDTTNRWSVPEIDQSSSSESYYKSFEKSESRPLDGPVEKRAGEIPLFESMPSSSQKSRKRKNNLDNNYEILLNKVKSRSNKKYEWLREQVVATLNEMINKNIVMEAISKIQELTMMFTAKDLAESTTVPQTRHLNILAEALDGVLDEEDM
ncbi:uncharacterized protein LOC119667688 [Teleopsis dalmanni]|uniref:uncharacterized protein LOC119667688 n=1 Tax=Teleopsis dalmanni TaxID=139649 RepID=UPI0018CF5A1D|nr:uncharacterized protein LOC119667688 [Teleopsis dalmanni]